MIYKLAYAVALLEKLCESQGLDYAELKKTWEARSQKAQEQYEAERLERQKKYEADAAEREEIFATRQAQRKARLSEHYPISFD